MVYALFFSAHLVFTHRQILNRVSHNHPTFSLGVSEDKGSRRTMEDAHSFVVDFDSIRGQGFYAIFDGHAGKHAAEWCGQHFHEVLYKTLQPRIRLKYLSSIF
jgi:protein phosphatase PTC1